MSTVKSDVLCVIVKLHNKVIKVGGATAAPYVPSSLSVCHTDETPI